MNENEKNARIFKAFCEANRLTILGLLQSGEKCACKLLEELNIGQPTLSHHMKILCDAEIVVGRKEGKWTYFFQSRGRHPGTGTSESDYNSNGQYKKI